MSSATPSGPLLRTAPAPLFLLSRLVRDIGIKVVLTGEGADEMFAGYDLFREAKIRRFWGRQPASTIRPRLLERLYPYLARSPVAQRALARAVLRPRPERWRGARVLARAALAVDRCAPAAVHARPARERSAGGRRQPTLLADAARRLRVAGRRSPRISTSKSRTLLPGYLLSSQGDRMLMAHSVEGRFPFLDRDLVALAELPAARLQAPRAGREARAQARRDGPGSRRDRPAAEATLPCPGRGLLRGSRRPDWVAEAVSERAVAQAGVFDPCASAACGASARGNATGEPLSNADNMALVGVLSTGLLFEQLVRRAPERSRTIQFQTVIDRWPDQDAGRPLARGSREMMST